MSHLKELLGEDLYNQVKEKIGDGEITIIAPGDQMVPKKRLDKVIAERNHYKEQLKERDGQHADLEAAGEDNVDLKAQIAELRAKNKQAAEEHEKQLREQRSAAVLERAVTKAGARNTRAVIGLLDTSKLSLDGETLIGLKEQVAALKQSDPYLFGVELKGRTPKGLNAPRKVENPWKKETWNLSKQGEIFRKDPNLAAKLRAQAKP